LITKNWVRFGKNAHSHGDSPCDAINFSFENRMARRLGPRETLVAIERPQPSQYSPANRQRYLDAADLGGAPTPIPLSRAALMGKPQVTSPAPPRLAPVGSPSDAICLGNPVQRNRVVGIEDDDGIAVPIIIVDQTKDLNPMASDKDIVVAD
jgi:hypothetical protein